MEVTMLLLLRNAARHQEENWEDILEENVKPKRRELEERLGV